MLDVCLDGMLEVRLDVLGVRLGVRLDVLGIRLGVRRLVRCFRY
jgi:hypothetical protein